MSALNAIGGAFAENAPVLHIVGTSSTTLKKNTDPFRQVHHLIPSKKTYEAPDHYVYEKLVEPFSIHTESLTDSNLEIIQSQIDSLIEDIVCHMKPGYLFIPSDLPDISIPVDLEKPLDFDFTRILSVDEDVTSKLVSQTLQKLYSSKNPGIVVDKFMRFDLDKVNAFLEKTNFYCYNTHSARGFADESLPNFHGVFNNEISSNGTLEIIAENDFVLYLGIDVNETNFYGDGSSALSSKDCIFIGKDYAKVGLKGQIITDVNAHVFFQLLLEQIDFTRLATIKARGKTAAYNTQYDINKDSNGITQRTFSKAVSGFLEENDVIVNEMCSFMFEIPNIRYKKGCHFVAQPFYGSIGYGIPATLGASLAMKDLKLSGRVLLFQGDGSAQMTLQELASFIRFDIDPIIFLLNNDGYGVERVIKGPTRSYNDIAAAWDWTKLLSVFGDPECSKSVSLKVSGVKELDDVLHKSLDFKDGKVKMLEIILGRMDVPDIFKVVAGIQ